MNSFPRLRRTGSSTRHGRRRLAPTDVSPALTGCLGFKDVNGITKGISWRFVDRQDVPAGPWLKIVTRSRGTSWR